MDKNDGGQACSKRDCGEAAVRRSGHQLLCAKHYRFAQMRSTAKRAGKVVPTHEQLANLFSRDGTTCRDCKREMNWLREDGADTQLTLQHYRSGSIGFVCLSCNTRHAHMPGDSYQTIQKDHKHCPQCETVKPFSDYSADNGRSGPIKLKSWCKECSSASHANWQRNNRDHYNETQRVGRARRAAG